MKSRPITPHPNLLPKGEGMTARDGTIPGWKIKSGKRSPLSVLSRRERRTRSASEGTGVDVDAGPGENAPATLADGFFSKGSSVGNLIAERRLSSRRRRRLEKRRSHCHLHCRESLKFCPNALSRILESLRCGFGGGSRLSGVASRRAASSFAFV